MKPVILFLEQQSWRSGAERVLDEVFHAIEPDFKSVVAFPEDGTYAAELCRRGIETVFFPLGRYRSGAKSVADMIAFGPRSLHSALRLSQIIRDRNAGLVYINSPRCLLAGVLAARLTGRPSLFHLHMTMTRRADLWLASRAARYATKIIACSQTSAMALYGCDRKLGGMMQVIYNPVRRPIPTENLNRSNRDLRTLLASSGRPLVGQVGRITPQKGHHILLKAAARLRDRGIDIHVAFVGAPEKNNSGDASYIQSLKTSVSALGLTERVRWAGYLEDPNVVYPVFDVLAIPSTVSEGLPMVALEALQWGLPIVGSRVGGIPEIVHDGINGFLVPPRDAEALSGCLGRLLSNDDLRTRLQSGARASIDGRFSFEIFKEQIRLAIPEFCPASDRVQLKTIQDGSYRFRQAGRKGNLWCI